MHKQAKLSELIEHYQNINNAWNMQELTKEERRAQWKTLMLRHYPDVKTCPFCDELPDCSPHHSSAYYSANVQSTIRCAPCDYEFNGAFAIEDNVRKWNTRFH